MCTEINLVGGKEFLISSEKVQSNHESVDLCSGQEKGIRKGPT